MPPIRRLASRYRGAQLIHHGGIATKRNATVTEYSDGQALPTSGVFKGMVGGNAIVRAGSDLEVKGIVKGDLFIEAGARVLVSGIVKGKVVHDGAAVVMTGIIGGE